jgi:hypothetical protein
MTSVEQAFAQVGDRYMAAGGDEFALNEHRRSQERLADLVDHADHHPPERRY